MSPPHQAPSDRVSWRCLPPPIGPHRLRSRGVLCTDPLALEPGGLGLYREGGLRAVVAVLDVRLKPGRIAQLTLRVLAQGCPPGRTPRYSRGVMQVSARLPDGMFMIWRLWTLTAEATSPACVEAVERRLVSPEWDWWGRDSVP
ncbi:MAG: hypothetical protein P8R54_03405 [Myxococcota bacterium]|nr:hypothetical protein [Myxococcota bacterium]